MMAAWAQALLRDGFVHVGPAPMHAALAAHGMIDWDGFAASWNDLGPDTYMADGGRYRKRRHAAFSASAGELRRKPHQPHYQSRDYNALNGGIERWFEPVTTAIGEHPALGAVLATTRDLFEACTPPARRPEAWHVEVHQFRVEAKPGEPGQPTPEGMHRDGVDWVLVMLVRRQNVGSGETRIADLQQRDRGSFTLSQPMESALVDDSRVYHGVTAVTPTDPARPAHRDVLVVTYRRE